MLDESRLTSSILSRRPVAGSLITTSGEVESLNGIEAMWRSFFFLVTVWVSGAIVYF